MRSTRVILLAVFMAALGTETATGQDCFDYRNYAPYLLDFAGGPYGDVATDGSLVYATDFSGRFRIIDFSRLDQPEVLADTTLASGLCCIEPHGTTIVVGFTSEPALILDVTDLRSPRVVQSIPLVQYPYDREYPISYYLKDVVCRDELMYFLVTRQLSGREIWTFRRDPEGRYEQVDVYGFIGGTIRDNFKIVDSLMYVASRFAGLEVFTIDDDGGLAPVASYNPPEAPLAAYDVAAVGDRLLVSGYFGDLTVFDLSHLPVIEPVARVGTGLGPGVLAVGPDETAYLADGTVGLSTIDISDVDHPVPLGVTFTPGGSHGVVALPRGKVAVANGEGLWLVRPRVGNEGPLLGISDFPLQAVAASGDIIYGRGDTREFLVLRPNGGFGFDLLAEMPVDINWSAARAAGNYVWIGGEDGWGSCQVIDVTDPLAPRVALTIDGPKAKDAAFTGTSLVLGNPGLRIHDLTAQNPSAPADTFVIDCASVEAGAGRAYAVYRGVSVYDVSQPSECRRLGAVSFQDINGTGWTDVAALADDRLVVLVGNNMVVVDVSDDTRPFILSITPLQNPYPRYVEISDGFVYVSTWYDGTGMYELADGTGPGFLGRLLGGRVDSIVATEAGFCASLYGRLVSVAPTCAASVPVAVSGFRATLKTGEVELYWETSRAVAHLPLRLRATCGARTWAVPYDLAPDGTATARDPLGARRSGETVFYRLEIREGADGWSPLAEYSLSVPAGRLEILGTAPNPFNSATTVNFSVQRAGAVRLAVFDPAGRLVHRLVDVDLPAGRHAATWDGRDASGRAVASGTYLLRLEANGGIRTGRLVLVK